MELKPLRLLDELARSGLAVRLAMPSDEMYQKNLIVTSRLKRRLLRDRISGFPGFNKSVQSAVSFTNFDTVWVKNWKEFDKLIREADAVIYRTGRNRQDQLLDKLCKLKVPVVIFPMRPSIYGFSIVRRLNLPNLYLAPSLDEVVFSEIQYQIRKIEATSNVSATLSDIEKIRSDKWTTIERVLTKNKGQLPAVNKETTVRITGALEFDDYFDFTPTNSSFLEFCARYKLNPNKPIITFLPGAPGRMDREFQESYKEICSAAVSAGFNIVVSGHPTDHTRRRRHKELPGRPDQPSWEVLGPNLISVTQADRFAALRYSLFAICYFTNSHVVANLAGRPAVIVDRARRYLPCESTEFLERSMVEDDFDFKVREFGLPLIVRKFYEENPTAPIGAYCENAVIWDEAGLQYYGCDISIGALNSFLEHIKRVPPEPSLYQETLTRLNKKSNAHYDGKVFKRMAREITDFVKIHA
jgi:hypothetical protein